MNQIRRARIGTAIVEHGGGDDMLLFGAILSGGRQRATKPCALAH
jgi:hypothetical protein